MRRVVDDPEDARARAAARARVVSRYSQAAVADLLVDRLVALEPLLAEREKERDEEEARERAEAERVARRERGGFGGGFGAEDYKSGYRMREALGWSRGAAATTATCTTATR